MSDENIKILISQYIDGQLDEAQSAEVEKLIAENPEYAEYYRQLKALESRVDSFDIGGDDAYWESQKDAVLDKIVNKGFFDRCLNDIYEPLCHFICWLLAHRCEESFRVPTNPFVTCLYLNNRAAKCAYTYDWMHRGGPISNQEGHCTPWSRGILVCPRVSEVAPDILKPQVGERTSLVWCDDLYVWINYLAQHSLWI